MEKDFYRWSKLKNELERKRKKLFFHEREIWFCSLGTNIGHEQDGKQNLYERPILIVKKFNQNLFWAIPITSTQKTGSYYFSIPYNSKDYSAILSQLRILDKKRLQRKIYMISKEEHQMLKNKLQDILMKKNDPL